MSESSKLDNDYVTVPLNPDSKKVEFYEVT